MEEIILQIVMKDDGEITTFDIKNIAKSEKGQNQATNFIKTLATCLNKDNLEYIKMKTDRGEVILK